MLLPEQVVPFLQHDEPIVRSHALRYFRDSYDFGPLTADHYWAAIDRFGENDQTLDFVIDLRNIPQTDASLRRLLRALADKANAEAKAQAAGRPLNETLAEFGFHYQAAARDMELAVLVRNREELLGCQELAPRTREHLELRLNLLDQPPTDAWDRLMQQGRELAGKYAGRFDSGLTNALTEAAARGGDPVCEQALLTLADEAALIDWRRIFAVRVLGLARYEPAVDALVQTLAIDTDLQRDEANIALARIATPRVIERLADFYPGKPWHVRLYAHSALAHIKRPESVDGLLKMLAVELALDADPDYDDEGEPLVEQVLRDLPELISLAGLEESRRLIANGRNNPEAIHLCECLLATALMTNVELPETRAWRRLLKKRNERIIVQRRNFNALCGRLSEQVRKTIANLPLVDDMDDYVEDDDENDIDADTFNGTADGPSEDIPDWEAPASSEDLPDRFRERLKPIRNTAPKIGRNDPCPCGSGKKYKKCCGK